MANVYGINVLKDDTQHAVIKLTAKFDGTGQETNTARIVANTLSGALATNGFLVANTQGGSANTTLPYYGLAINRLWYDCSGTANSDVELYWTATASNTAFFMNGNGEYDGAGNWITIPNPTAGAAGSNGNIGITTRGMGNGDSYTIILELRKDNAFYQRGQFNDPAAFNYGPNFGLRP
jgi:hypothetical protein